MRKGRREGPTGEECGGEGGTFERRKDYVQC